MVGKGEESTCKEHSERKIHMKDNLLLGYSTADEIVASKTDLAIIAVGSIEQHGPHLPVITDWVIADEMGKGIAKKTGGFYVQALPVSTCREHMGKRGSVWMNPDTFYLMLKDICLSLKEQGFKRIGIIQSHGGIFVMSPLIRELNATNAPDLMVVKVSTGDYSAACREAGIVESKHEMHAGEKETSVMLYLRPELVNMDKAVDFVPDIPREYFNYGSIFHYCPDGVWGEPTKATADKGKRILELMIEEGAKDLEKIFTMMANKEKTDYSWF